MRACSSINRRGTIGKRIDGLQLGDSVEYRAASSEDAMDWPLAISAKKFEAQLNAADMVPDLRDESHGLIKIRGVDGDVERVSHIASPDA